MAITFDPSKIKKKGSTASLDGGKLSFDPSKIKRGDKEATTDRRKKYQSFFEKYSSFEGELSGYLSREKKDSPFETGKKKADGPTSDFLRQSDEFRRSFHDYEWDDPARAARISSSSEELKKEAEELLRSLESEKDYFTGEGYSAYKQLLSSIAAGDGGKLSDVLKGEAAFRSTLKDRKSYDESVAANELDRELSEKYKDFSTLELIAKAEGANDLPEEERRWLESKAASSVSAADIEEMKTKGATEGASKYNTYSKLNSVGREGDRKYKENTLERDRLQRALDEYAVIKNGPTADRAQRLKEWQAQYGDPQELYERVKAFDYEIEDYLYWKMLKTVPENSDFKKVVSRVTGYRTSSDDKIVRDRSAAEEYANDSDRSGFQTFIEKLTHMDPDSRYSYLTDREYEVYAYLIGTDHPEKERFIAHLEAILDERMQSMDIAEVSRLAKEHPGLASAYSVVYSLGSGAEYAVDTIGSIGQNIKNTFDGTVGYKGYDIKRNELAEITNATRGSVAEEIDWKIGEWDAGSFVYNTLMSGIDSAASMAAFGMGGGAALGLTAAAQGTNDALDRGLSNDKAFWAGIANGTFEMLFETFSISQFKAMQETGEATIKGFAKNIGKSMLTNASEETLTEIANITYDIIANADLSSYELAVQKYIDENKMSTEEAHAKARLDIFLQVLESGASGALMGIGFGAAGNAAGAQKAAAQKAEAMQAEQFGGELLTMHGGAEAFAGEILSNPGIDSTSQEILLKKAEKLRTAKTNKKGEYSGEAKRLAAELYEEALSATDSTAAKERVDIIRKKLESKGLEAAEASKIAEEISSAIGYEDATKAFKTKYSGNGAVLSAFEELTDSESEGFDSSLFDSVSDQQRAMISLAMGRAHFDADYAEDGGRISERDSELSEIVGFEETVNEDGDSITVPVIKVGEREVSASDIELSADSIYTNVDGMELDLANEMIRAYKKHGSNMGAAAFASQWKTAYQMGLANRSADSADFKGYGFKISSEAAEAARALGQAEYRGERAAQEKEIDRARKNKSRREGRISTAEVQNKEKISKGAMDAARILSVAGYNIEFFEDASETADRGSYRWSTNTIRLNVDVGTGRGGIDYVLGRTLSHEITHSIQRWNPQGYEALKDFIIEKMGDSFEGMVSRKMNRLGLKYAEAVDEVVADSCEMMLRDTKALSEFAKEHRTVFEKICDIIEEFINNIRKAISSLYGESTALHDEARFMELYADELQAVFDKVLSETLEISESTVDHSLQSNANKKAAEDGGRVQKSAAERYSDYNKPITAADVETLRSIGRKSINNFTSEDIQKAQKWAYKFYKELGVKSPFFRAWFGDWRATQDIVYIPISDTVNLEGKNPRGTFKNKDTGWNISSSSVGYDETVSHSGKDKLSLLAMRNIDQIIEHSILLDTEVSEYGRGKKSIYTAFMHKFYAPIRVDGKVYIAKLAVDESYAPGQKDTNKKFYHVRSIKIEATSSVGIGENHHTPIMEDNASVISISDLFALVKQYDEDFKPKPVHDLLIDKGNPRKFYHGTNSEFFEFDLEKSGANYGDTSEGLLFFTSKKGAYPDSATDYAREITKKKGGKETVREVYVSMQKPLVLDSRGYYTTQAYFDQNHEEIYNKYLQGDYDGIIIHNSDKSADDAVLAIVDNAGQVKSATYSEDLSGPTDNIGTFDRGQKDIRYSRSEAYEAAENGEADSEGNTLSKGQQKYFKDSLVRDEDGNLLVVYHGSEKGGFTVFDSRFSDDKLSLFFTRSRAMAKSYSGTYDAMDIPGAKKGLAKAFEGNTKKSRGKAGIYKVYLNLTNPLIIDAKGSGWNGIADKGADAVQLCNMTITPVYGAEDVIDSSSPVEISIETDGGESFYKRFKNHHEMSRWLTKKYGGHTGTKVHQFAINAEKHNTGQLTYSMWLNSEGMAAEDGDILTTRELAERAKARGHDGVIIKNLFDYGDPNKTENPFPNSNDVYIVFDSNQAKDVGNANPTGHKDIRYSRGEGYTAPDYAMMPEFSEPLNVNYTGEGYTSESGLKLYSKYSVDTARDFIMSELGLKEGKTALAKELNEFYTFMATAERLTWEDIEERAGAIADKYLKAHRERTARDPGAQEALDTIRRSYISLDGKQKTEAKAFYGSFGKYRQSLMGRVNIVSDGISLDSQWQEWAELYPEYFPADTNSNDMPRVLFEAIEKMKNSRADDGFSLSEEEEHDRAVQLIYDSFRKVAIESISQETDLYGTKKVYGESLLDALERTVQTQEDKAIIDSYRNIEADTDRKRAELSSISREIHSLAFSPYDAETAARLQGLRRDTAALEREIRETGKEVAKARDAITVTEKLIADPKATDDARGKALGRIAAQRQTLARLERALSAKKTTLSEKKAEIEKTRDPKVKRLETLHKEETRLRKEISAADASLLDLRATERFKTLLARERAQAIRDTKDIMYRRQGESRARQKGSVIRQRIWKEMQKLDKLLASGTVAKHVPSDMKSTVAALSQAVAGRDIDYDAKIAALDEKLAETTGDEYKKALEAKEKYELYKTSAERTAKGLEALFSSLSEDSPIFDEGVYNDVQSIGKSIAGRSLNELENSELEKLLEVVNEVKAAIKNADRVFGERKSLSAIGRDATAEVLSQKDETERGPLRQKLHDSLAKTGYSMLKPYELFEMTGSNTLYERFKKLQAREGTYFADINEASSFYKDAAEKCGITKRSLKEKFAYKTAEGREIALSVDQIMSIYLMSRRSQAMIHLTNPSGGFRFAGGYTVEAKKVKNAKDESGRLKAVKYAYKHTSDPVHLTEIDVYAISKLLTTEQKDFADSIQRFMADTLGAKGNEVSEALYDVKKFTDPDYFPIHTDAGYRLLSIEKAAGEIQLKNLGFTKDLKYNASGPLVLEDMSSVFARHANEMSLYHSFALELENLKRVLNYSPAADEDAQSSTDMKAALGDMMTAEIVDFIKSVNGGVRSDNVDFADRLISLNKGARVGASLSVAIQQPSAVIRAFSMIDPKHVTGLPGMQKVDARREGSLWEEMKKYTATAGIKELGGVDINTSGAIREHLTDIGPKGRSAGENIIKGVQKFAYRLPEIGDRAAWTLLWSACKREAAQTYRGDAILTEAGRRFDEIVNRTQVYDSVFSRSKIMRSQNTFAKMVTAFMAEPMTTANMVIQASRDISSKDPSRKRAGMRSLGAVSASVIINNALVSIIYAMRDDDEDESYLEKITESFLQKMGMDLNPFSYIPMARDVISLFQGYDVERMDMSLISDIIDSLQKLTNLSIKEDATSDEWVQAFIDFGSSILDFTGIPASNLSREFEAVANTFNNAKTKTTRQGFKEAVMDGLFEESKGIAGKLLRPSEGDADKLYRAIKSGDKERFKQITDRLTAEGKTTKQIQSLIVSGLKNNDERVTTAAEHKLSGETAEYEKLLREISKDGFASSYVAKAIASKASQLTPEDSEEDDYGAPDPSESEEFYSIYNGDDIFVNLEAGDLKEAQKVIDDIYLKKYQKALTKLKADEDEDDADKSARSSLRSMISSDYRELYKNSDKAERERISELLLSIEINGEQLYNESTIDKWGED